MRIVTGCLAGCCAALTIWFAVGQEPGGGSGGSRFDAEQSRIDDDFLLLRLDSVEAGESLEARVERIEAWLRSNDGRLRAQAALAEQIGIDPALEESTLSALQAEAASLEQLCEKVGQWAAGEDGSVALRQMRDEARTVSADEPADGDEINQLLAQLLSNHESASLEETCALIGAGKESISTAISNLNIPDTPE